MPGRVIRVRTLVLGAGLLLLALVVFAAVNAITGDGKSGGRVTGGSGEDFTLTYPNSWTPLSGRELATQPGRPLAVIKRNDGKGFVVLRKETKAPKDFGAFAGELSRALDKRIPDFQKRTSKIVTIAAGKAFFFSYIRKKKGTVHTIVLVPAGKRSYVLNTVSSGASQSVARQIARIILSFKA